jgi:hypothetical protein
MLMTRSDPSPQEVSIFLLENVSRLLKDREADLVTSAIAWCSATSSPDTNLVVLACAAVVMYADLIRDATPDLDTARRYVEDLGNQLGGAPDEGDES